MVLKLFLMLIKLFLIKTLMASVSCTDYSPLGT